MCDFHRRTSHYIFSGKVETLDREILFCRQDQHRANEVNRPPCCTPLFSRIARCIYLVLEDLRKATHVVAAAVAGLLA
jgi:hypothetical protein